MRFPPRTLTAAEAGDRTDDGLVVIDLLRVGEWFGTQGGSIKVTPDVLDDIERNLPLQLSEGWYGADNGPPIKLDPAHRAFSGEDDSPALKAAYGRVQRVERSEDGQTLRAAVAWSDEGRVIAPKFSISFEARSGLTSKTTGEPVEGWCLTGAVLTDTPMIPGLRMAASEDPTKEHPMPFEQTLAALGLSESANDGAALAAAEKIKTALKAAEERATLLAGEVKALAAERDGLKVELDKLAAAEEQRTLDQAVSDGRITAAERPRYAKVLATLGADETHAVFPKGRVNVKPTGANAKPADAADLDPVAVNREVGELANKLIASEKLTRFDAITKATREIAASDPRKAEILGA